MTALNFPSFSQNSIEIPHYENFEATKSLVAHVVHNMVLDVLKNYVAKIFSDYKNYQINPWQVGTLPELSLPASSNSQIELPRLLSCYLQPVKIPSGEIRFLKLIGGGTYGDVYESIYTSERFCITVRVATKVSKIYDNVKKTDFAKEYVQKEAGILKKINFNENFESSFINRYIDSGELDAKRFFLVQSLQPYDLYTFQSTKYPAGMPLRKISTIARQLFKALSFLRQPQLEVIHCDIKPQNVLVSEHKDDIKIRLIDFNASKIGQKVILEKDYIVSRFYRAPEIILKLPYTFKSDLWSAGCLLFELFSGEPLFPASNEAELITMMYELMGPLHETFVHTIPNYKNGFISIADRPGFYAVKPIFYRNPHIEHRRLYFDRILNTKPNYALLNFFFTPKPVDSHLIQFKELLLSIFKWTQDERPSVADLQEYPFILDYLKT